MCAHAQNRNPNAQRRIPCRKAIWDVNESIFYWNSDCKKTRKMLFAVTMFGRRRMASVIFAVSPSISNSNSSNFQNQQKRTIYSKYAVPEYAKNMPPPWPYKERGYRTFHQFLDFGFSKRMGENSKLIIVEGNTGKNFWFFLGVNMEF